MTEKEQSVSTDVINLVASVINNTEPPQVKNDWESIVDFASKQRILNIVAYAVDKMENKPSADVLKTLKSIKMQCMLMEATQEIEFDDAMNTLEKAEIRHMPLKGYLVKNLYPSPDMRTMSDLDLLIDKENVENAVKLFTAQGFNYIGEGDLHANVKRGDAYIEFHHSMVNDKYVNLVEYYKDCFDRAEKIDGHEYRYRQSAEDLYVFLIIHLAKHYRYGGTGIRTVLDLYVYEKQCAELDFEYIEAETTKLGVNSFYKKMRELAFRWFDGSFNGEYDTVSLYIISGGVYGKVENVSQNSFIAQHNSENMAQAKFKNTLSAIFPKYDIMSIRYPILKKLKFLLPIFWIIRVFDTMINNPKNIKDQAYHSREINNIDSTMIEIQRLANLDEVFKTE